MISMDKQYRTRDGRKARILCVDRAGNYPVVALVGEEESPYTFTAEGKYSLVDGNHLCNLVEYHPAQDWPVNHPIWVRDRGCDPWIPRHFAKYEDGVLFTFAFGSTSHTLGNHISFRKWDFFTDVNPNQEK